MYIVECCGDSCVKASPRARRRLGIRQLGLEQDYNAMFDPFLVLEYDVRFVGYSTGLYGIDLFHALLSLYRVEFWFLVQ